MKFNRLKNRFVSFLFILTLPCMVTAGQHRVLYYSYGQGLTTDLIKSTIQDTLGFIWIASDQGVIRYDGVQFHTYRDGFPTSFIKTFLRTTSGELYAIHDAGITLLDQSPNSSGVDTSTRFPYGASELLYPKAVYEDRQARIWIAEPDVIVRYDSTGMRRYPFRSEDRSSNFFRSFDFFEDSAGHFYTISISGRLFRFDEQNNRFFLIPLNLDLQNISDVVPLQDDQFLIGATEGLYRLSLLPEASLTPIHTGNLDVSSIMLHSEGTLYVGTWSYGLWYCDNLSCSRDLKPVDELSIRKVNNLMEDEDGGVWVSTDAGIVLLKQASFQTIRPDSLYTYINMLFAFDENRIGVCHDKGLSLVRMDDYEYSFETIYRSIPEVVMSAAVTDRGTWLGMSSGEIRFLNRQGRVRGVQVSTTGRSLFNLCTDGDGNVWTGLDDTAAVVRVAPDLRKTVFSAPENLTSRINIIRQAPDGELYFGGEGVDRYLFVFERETGTFRNVSVPLPRAMTEDFSVNDIAFDGPELIWLGTNRGLFKISEGQAFSTHHGMMENTREVTALVMDQTHHLWIAFLDGMLLHYNDQTGSDNMYGITDGLPSRTLSYRGMMVDRFNQVWVSTSAGVVREKTNLEPNPTPVPVVIDLRQNGRSLPLRSEGIDVLHGELLELYFSAPYYPQQDLVYEYFTANTGDSWRPVTSRNPLILSELVFGKQRVQLRVHQMGKSETAAILDLPIVVHARWFESPLALVLYVALFIAVVWAYSRAANRKLARENVQLELMIQRRTDEAMAQYDRVKQAEVEAQQLRIKNEIAATVAHEFNNPLAVIKGVIDLQEMAQLSQEQKQKQYNKIRGQVERMHNLVQSLLRINELKEVDYAAGMKILDLHGTDENPQSGKDQASRDS